MNEDKKCMDCNGYGGMGCYRGHRKIFAFILALVVAFIFVGVFDNNGKDSVQKDTIVVSGKGELTVKPDIATVSFSVMEENMDVAKASDAVNKQIANIINTLKTDGIDEKDIKTTGYSVYPRYDYTNSQIYPYNGKQVLAGYDVTQSIEVKIRDLANASKVVTDLGTLKVTNISGLNFTEDKYDDLVRQARDQAIADARDQAKSLAKSLGVKLVKIVSYSEGGNYPYPVYAAKTTMGAGVMDSVSSAVLPTGTDKITSNVSITYEIR